MSVCGVMRYEAKLDQCNFLTADSTDGRGFSEEEWVGENETHNEPNGEFVRAPCFGFNGLIPVNLCDPRLISSELLGLS